jgi:AraC-like DNA-binding protein
MQNLPLKYKNSEIFPRDVLTIRPGVHITNSSGSFDQKTARESKTTSSIFELSYNRKNTISGEVNHKLVELRPGYASLGFLGQTTGYSEYDSGEEIQLYSIWVSPDAFNDFCESVRGNRNMGFQSFQQDAYYRCDFKSDVREENIMNKLDRCFMQTGDCLNKLLVESYLLEIMSLNIERLFCTNSAGNQTNHLTRSDMEQLIYAREILLNRLVSPPSLLELSHIIHMNDCKLKRTFKQCFGKTVYEFIREQRLEKAFTLLHHEEHNVSEAAFAVGYTNVSHFSEAFKKKYGFTPRALCKQIYSIE